jgi:signal transduction histidine kinase
VSSHHEIAEPAATTVSYSPDGGPVEVSIARRDHSVRFSVYNRGLGVPAGDQRRIFDKFYRLDPNLTRGVGGTGLGLYICRELVRRMEGSIWVESRVGEGSRFTFELPSAEQSGATARSGLAGRSGSRERSS